MMIKLFMQQNNKKKKFYQWSKIKKKLKSFQVNFDYKIKDKRFHLTILSLKVNGK